MKNVLLSLIISTNISICQTRAEILLDAQKDVTAFWKASFDKHNKYFILPTFTYINGAYNVYYSSNENQIITSLDLIKDVFNTYGDAVVYFIYAHEFGHFIQHNTQSTDIISIFREYGADCFAGIYFKHLGDNKRLEKGDYENVVRFITDNTEKEIKLKDLFSLDSHGTAEFRIKAFNEGFTNNDIKFCRTNYNPTK